MYNKVVNGVRDLGVIKGATGPHIIEVRRREKVRREVRRRNEDRGQRVRWTRSGRSHRPPRPGRVARQAERDIVAGSSDMTYRAVRPGLHPGSELIEGAMDMGQFARRSASEGVGLANPEVLPQTICHDNWVLTRDRDRSDNHLIRPVDGHFRYTMVDFTHGFTGPSGRRTR